MLERAARCLKEMFAATSRNMRRLRSNGASIEWCKKHILTELEPPIAQPAIANNTDNCAQSALEMTMMSVVDQDGDVHTTPAHERAALCIAKRLLDLDVHQRIRADAHRNNNMPTPLLIAIENADDVELRKALVDRGAGPAVVGKHGRNAATLAIFHSHTAVLKVLLLTFGKEHNIWAHIDDKGNNAVTLAARYARPVVLGLLFSVYDRDNSEAWMHKNEDGETATDVAFHVVRKNFIRRVNFR